MTIWTISWNFNCSGSVAWPLCFVDSCFWDIHMGCLVCHNSSLADLLSIYSSEMDSCSQQGNKFQWMRKSSLPPNRCSPIMGANHAGKSGAQEKDSTVISMIWMQKLFSRADSSYVKLSSKIANHISSAWTGWCKTLNYVLKSSIFPLGCGGVASEQDDAACKAIVGLNYNKRLQHHLRLLSS